ncbi:MAG: hypothetical protein IJ648_05570 [Lachnospiraceae bacterium]|nr:hypothetical protein [Lachnospiraceae bacterium]
MKKIGCLLLAVCVLTLQGCTTLRSYSDEARKAVEAKYGEPFTATEVIGNSYNVKVFLYPDSNEELMFTASIDQDDGTVSDDYLVQLVNEQINKNIEQCFIDSMINSSARCYAVSDDAVTYVTENDDPKSLMEACGMDYYVTYVIIDTDCEPETLKDLITRSCQEQEIDMIAVVFVLPDTNYEKCRREMRQNPEMNESLIKRYDPIHIYAITVNEDETTLTVEK